MLRLEAGEHTSSIDAIASDAQGRLVLTVSSDKTARLWEMPSRRLLRVFRPPFGGTKDGALYAGALSPDGTLVALGGYCASESSSSRESRVILFDTTTGLMAGSFDGLPNVVFKLAFSESGDYLAAGLGGPNGIYVWNMRSKRLIGTDLTYKDSCEGLDWHGDERLASASFDGNARLYDVSQTGLHRTACVTVGLSRPDSGLGQFIEKLQGITVGLPRNQPHGIKFAPDGTKLAIGFYQQQALCEIRDSHDLSLILRPDCSRMIKGNLSEVCWSADGHTLKAAGNWQDRNGRTCIVSWSEDGRRWDSADAIGVESIRDLHRMTDGSILYASADPSWGVCSPGAANLHRAVPCFDQIADHLEVSDDGWRVKFQLEVEGASPVVFDLRNRLIATESDDLSPPMAMHRAKRAGVHIENWRNTDTPKLNGRKLPFKDNEVSRSIAVSADETFFILGSGWAIRRFTSDGDLVWSLPSDGAWGVNLADDDKLLVVAEASGIIRWLDARTGTELQSLFVQPETKEWIVWSSAMRKEPMPLPDLAQFDAEYSTAISKLRFDRVVSVAGVRVSSANEADAVMNRVVREARPGDAIVSTLLRGNRLMDVGVTVKPLTEWISLASYYDCTPGAEELLGWHVNRGNGLASDFFPAARFHSIYYRPDIVRRVQSTADVDQAISEGNRAMGKPNADISFERIKKVLARMSPPVVTLITGGFLREIEVPFESTSTKLRYSVRSTTSEKTSRVEVRLNGRPVLFDAPIPSPGREAEIDVPIPAGFTGELSVVASHSIASSQPEVIRLRRSGQTQSLSVPDLYVLAVGVARLKANVGPKARTERQGLVFEDLITPAEDARLIATGFAKQGGKAFAKVHQMLLLDAEATRENILQALTQIASKAKPGDVVVFNFEGHGHTDAEHEFFLVTHDTDPNNPVSTGLGGSALVRALSRIHGYVVLMLGTCDAGAALSSQRTSKIVVGPGDLSGLVSTLGSSEHGVVVFAAAHEGQKAVEIPGTGDPFASAISEGLSGVAAVNGKISWLSLQGYVSKRLPEILDKTQKGLPQRPYFVQPKGVPDFLIGKL